jgi:uncharacterized lipoprotein YddW (UPF0748 family)
MSEKRDTEQSESSRLEGLYRKVTDPVLRTHLLMVWRIYLGDSIPEVAEMVGYSQKWVTEIARRYNSDGVEKDLVIVATPTPALRRGRCSTKRAKHACAKLLLRRLRPAEACGAGRRWHVGSSGRQV